MGIRELQANNVTVATPSELDRARSPEIIFTDGYLNDPIQYRPDQRFTSPTLVQQFSELPNQLERDFAEFLQIDSNTDTPQLLTVSMYSGVTRRDLYAKVFGSRSKFTQLGVTR